MVKVFGACRRTGIAVSVRGVWWRRPLSTSTVSSTTSTSHVTGEASGGADDGTVHTVPHIVHTAHTMRHSVPIVFSKRAKYQQNPEE